MDTILVVDDEPSLLESVRFLLEQNQFQVVTAASGPQALEQVRLHSPSLLLLDVMLPGLDGLEVCRQLRSRGFAGPILLLTARDQEIDQVVGLEIGADDYITKPFRHRELLARVRAHLRRLHRAPGDAPGALRCGPLEVFPERREARLNNHRLDLTPKEFQLLSFLLQNRRRAQSRERILEAVWGYDYDGEDRVINVTVQRLRDKIEPDPTNPSLILTVRGLGYMLEGPEGDSV